VPAQDRIRGDQQPQAPAARLGYHAEQGPEQGSVCPVQLRAARLPPLQDRELVARDQDPGGLPRLLAPDSRSHPVSCVVRRSTNRRHMTGDHHVRNAGRATLLFRGVDALLGMFSSVYGVFATALGLVAWIYLSVEITVTFMGQPGPYAWQSSRGSVTMLLQTPVTGAPAMSTRHARVRSGFHVRKRRSRAEILRDLLFVWCTASGHRLAVRPGQR